jgi:hypothetical protein
MRGMIMKLITDEVRTLKLVEYDINIHTHKDDPFVNLVFYPLVYPGDEGYKANSWFGKDYNYGIPIADYTHPHVLRIPKRARGPKYNEAFAYLEEVVVYGSDGDEWDVDGMDWTSVENVLDDTSALINEFRATLPRRAE